MKKTFDLIAGLSLLAVINVALWTALAVGLLSAAEAQCPAPLTCSTATWAGNVRTYGVYVPKNVPANPSIVFYLHGTFAGSALPWNTVSQWTAWAAASKFIVVFPLSTYQAATNSSFWAANDVAFLFPSDPDDVGWLCSLVAQLTSQYSAGNAYVTGMSSGGMMTQRVGMTCPQELSAIAPVSGQISMTQSTDAWTPPTKIAAPVSVLEIHGDADTDLEYCGSYPHIQWGATWMRLPSVDTDIAFWAAMDGLPAPTVELCANGKPSGATGETLSGAGVEVEFLDNPGGGHVWPSWAYATIVQFFEEHGK
jgi:poly(3-hydroxybutyrate) depolymerase